MQDQQQRELNLEYLVNEPKGFVQDFYHQKAQTSEGSFNMAMVSISLIKFIADQFLLIQLQEIVGNEENTFPTFVHTLLNIDAKEAGQGNAAFDQIPCVNTCLTPEALLEHDSKLVRFDCQIIDMFEEEYYVGVVPATKNDSSEAAAATAPPLVFKYFNVLSSE